MEREASIQNYVKSKNKFIKKKEKLIEVIAKDMKNVGAKASDIYKISKLLEGFGKSLDMTTSSLIDMMTDEMGEIKDFPDPGVYRDTLIEENSWLEGEALSMRYITAKWMGIHKKEVAGERAKLVSILETSEQHGILDMMKITGDLIDDASDVVLSKVSIQ